MAPPIPDKTRGQGLTLTLLASVIWGSSFVAIQVGLEFGNPLLLTAMRFVLAAAGVFLVAPFLGATRSTLRELREPRMWGLGALYSVGFILQFVGQYWSGIGSSTLLSNLFPAFVPLFASPLLRERVGGRHVAAILVSILGLLVVALPSLGSGGTSLLGDAFLLGSALDYALFIVVSKRIGADRPEHSLALIGVMGILFAPLLVGWSVAQPSALSLPAVAWGAILYLAFPCTILALTLYLLGLGRVSASHSSMLLLLEPVTGLGLATIWFRSSVTIPIVLGGILVVGAIAIASWPHRPVPQSPGPTGLATSRSLPASTASGPLHRE